MTLYNCRHAGDEYRITKFSNEMDVESSYLCTPTECQCPAGVRPTCRHREMLPKFLSREHVGDEWFYDYDRGGWVQQGLEWAQPEAEALDLPDTVGEPRAQPVEPSSPFMKRRFL